MKTSWNSENKLFVSSFKKYKNEDNSKLCLGYLDENKREWYCEDGLQDCSENYHCGKTDHFTNFAIISKPSQSEVVSTSSSRSTFSLTTLLGVIFGIVAFLIILIVVLVILFVTLKKRKSAFKGKAKSELFIRSELEVSEDSSETGTWKGNPITLQLLDSSASETQLLQEANRTM